MKKNLTISISVFLILMSLVYFGIFRDFSNPIDVTRYYFECLKNRESFLTYPISKPEFFKEDRDGKFYGEYKLRDLIKIECEILDRKNAYAQVQTALFYRSHLPKFIKVNLKKEDGKWLIINLE